MFDTFSVESDWLFNVGCSHSRSLYPTLCCLSPLATKTTLYMRFIKLIKIFNSFLILVTSLFFITCSNSTTLQTEKTIDKPTSPPILEISEDAEGAWNITGKTLFFRLYENGVVEFEYPDDTKVKSGQNKAEEINILKRIKISEEDKQKFIKLLNTENFQGLQESYQRKCCCTDATTRYEINFQSSNKEVST